MLTQEATILDPTSSTTDRYNDDVDTFVDTSGKVWPCRVEPATDQEMEDNRDTRHSWFRLFLSEHATGHITALSRVVVEGTTYQVWGEPNTFHTRQKVSHVECRLRIVGG